MDAIDQVVFGTTYYYEVTADDGAEGPASSEVSMDPTPKLPWGIFEGTMKQVIYIHQVKSQNAYAENTYYGKFPAQSRIERKETQIQKGVGEVIISRIRITVDGTTDVDADDKIELTSGETLEAILVEDHYQQDGTIRQKVIFT